LLAFAGIQRLAGRLVCFRSNFSNQISSAGDHRQVWSRTVNDLPTKTSDLAKRVVADIASWLNENGYGTDQNLGIPRSLIKDDLTGIEREARSSGYRGGPLKWKSECELFIVFDSTIYEDETEVADLFASLKS
jgi:hypothetical protein